MYAKKYIDSVSEKERVQGRESEREACPEVSRYKPVLHCNTLQHTATHCHTLQHVAAHCHTLPHTATHCNTLALWE